jgi:uncharacterized protein (DUF58 family)
MFSHFISNVIHKRFNKWLVKRMPATKEIRLNSANIFIFPSKTGLHFLISCFILFLLGTNYQNNLILFLVFFLCSLMITCLLLSYQNLAGLTMRAIEPEEQFAATDCQFKLRLQQSETPIQDVSFSFQNASSNLHTVMKKDSVALYGYSKERGYFNPGRVTVRSSFPFGLFTVWTHLDFDFKVLLYPQPLENKIQEKHSMDNMQDNSAFKLMAGVDQFSTLKNYQQGESLKSVAWKQLAQGRGWLTKQFEQSAGGDVLLDINNLNYLPLETRLSFLSYQIIELQKVNQRYALTLNNYLIETNIGKNHKHRCLQALALFDLPLSELSPSQSPDFQISSSKLSADTGPGDMR